MHVANPDPRHPRFTHRSVATVLSILLLVLTSVTPFSSGTRVVASETLVEGTPITAAGTAIVNFTVLSTLEMIGMIPPVRPLIIDEFEAPEEPPAPPGSNTAKFFPPGPQINIASPAPSNSFIGLDDIPMVDSSYIIIPPDVDGAVGVSRIMQGLNNNYRIMDKASGATISTVGTATFWSSTGAVLNALTDPRTIYDPYNQRWIAVMQTIVLGASDILVGVSQTSDPAGSWYLYRFATASTVDFPTVGFNKNWITIGINKYTPTGSAFANGIMLAVNYPLARTGTGSGTLFNFAAGSHFSSSPAATYSAVQDTEWVVTHLSSAGATYTLDRITGTPAAPVYTLGATQARPGGGWTQPSGQILPQSAPNAGASACTPPCKIETQDSQVRSAPVWRNGALYYTQTIGLPAGALTHTSVQWTKLATPAGSFLDGGRLDDPTATSTNGGLWYAYPHIAVNAAGDFMVGCSIFSSALHPTATYAVHMAPDAAGTLRDAFIYKAGEDYYSKTFGSGRNRWGDFSKAQVDPCDDMTLWTVQEYAKNRTGTNDGNTGSNSSRWSTYWAVVNGPARSAGLQCPPDTIGSPGGGVTRMFRITNNGAGPDQFAYTITDAAGWGGPAAGNTPVLAPAGFFDVFVNFTIPSDCTPPNDVVTLSVLPVGGTNCYSPVTCTTKIFCDLPTATLVSRFDAARTGSGVELLWSSDAVNQIDGWNVYRAQSENGAWSKVNPDLIAMRSGGEFIYRDDSPYGGDLYYRLGAVMKGGGEEVMGSTRVMSGGQSFAFAITGNNPFSRSTTLRYSLPAAAKVRVEVYSVTGQRVRTLVDRSESPGDHSVDFSLSSGGRVLGPGVYLVRITAGKDQKTLRVVGME